ncbi:MAG: class I SAM-dependent methyltransferase [Giesbergeria sp.]
MLEIGCGWGASRRNGGDRVRRQRHRRYAVDRTAGLCQRSGSSGSACPLRSTICACRTTATSRDAPFDAICSIEMVEAVGREYWPTYFQAVARLLKPGGRACIQSIVIDDRLFERYIGSTDFIQQYIFPGGCLPCPRELHREAEAAGLRVDRGTRVSAPTMPRRSSAGASASLPTARRSSRQGFDHRFLHIWEFYLAYCEAAFAMGDIDVVQYTLHKTEL